MSLAKFSNPNLDRRTDRPQYYCKRYSQSEIPSQEKLLAQVETMYTAFYSHLRMLEKNRICPCNACATAPNLELKIVLHCGEMKFLTVQGNRKPFGEIVIEAHRLLKNSVKSDNYILIGDALAKEIELPEDYSSSLFHFQKGLDSYDERSSGRIGYAHSSSCSIPSSFCSFHLNPLLK